MAAFVRILGLDPGSVITGYGVIDHGTDGSSRVVGFGCVRTAGEAMPGRLRRIFEQLSAIVRDYAPEEVAVERLFVHRNADTALKLGQARGAALAACFAAAPTIHEYAPRQIKQAVVGGGGADKHQVQHMIRMLLALNETPPADAADALAVAICHAHSRGPLQAVTGRRR